MFLGRIVPLELVGVHPGFLARVPIDQGIAVNQLPGILRQKNLCQLGVELGLQLFPQLIIGEPFPIHHARVMPVNLLPGFPAGFRRRFGEWRFHENHEIAKRVFRQMRGGG